MTLGTEKDIDILIDDLINWDETTRANAAKELGKLGDEKAIEPLLKALKDDKAEDVRIEAAKALVIFYENTTVPKKLAELIRNEPSPIVRATIANSLGEMEDIEAIRKMVALLKDEKNIWVREAIVEAFGETKTDDFVPILLKVLEEDPAEEVRTQAALALSKFDSFKDKIFDLLMELFLKEKSDDVRSHLPEIIAKKQDEKVINFLLQVLELKNYPLTRAAAVEALRRIAENLGYKDENELLDSL
jgi:HEAT repeat protein